MKSSDPERRFPTGVLVIVREAIRPTGGTEQRIVVDLEFALDRRWWVFSTSSPRDLAGETRVSDSPVFARALNYRFSFFFFSVYEYAYSFSYLCP